VFGGITASDRTEDPNPTRPASASDIEDFASAFAQVGQDRCCHSPDHSFLFRHGAAHCVTVESDVGFGCRCGVYDSSMRDRPITVVGVGAVSGVLWLLLAACGGSGSDGDASASTVAVSTTAVVVTTVPPASSTAVSTTMLDDTAAQLAAAEQAYLEAFDAYIAAARDPANPELRAEIERLYTGPSLELTVRQLDGFVREGWVARSSDEPSRTTILLSPQFLPNRVDIAELVVCEVDSERFFEIAGAPDGTDALVTDEMTVGRFLLRLRLVEGQWKADSGEVLAELASPEECST
jgi:hypothetical protein